MKRRDPLREDFPELPPAPVGFKVFFTVAAALGLILLGGLAYLGWEAILWMRSGRC